MFLVVEKMGAAAVDEDDELLLVFWRLGGDSELLLVADMEVATEERGRGAKIGLMLQTRWGGLLLEEDWTCGMVHG